LTRFITRRTQLIVASTQRSQTTTMSDKPSFIVVFKGHVTPQQIKEYINEVNENGGEVTHEYEALNGFAANLPESFLHNFKSNELIKYVEPNSVVTTQ